MPRHTAAPQAEKGALTQAIGRSRGGRTTKLHALVDGLGRPVALAITPGQRGDAPEASDLLSQAPLSRILAADTAYDSTALRAFLAKRGTTPVIPNNPARKRHFPFDRTLYRRRNIIERSFSQLKDYRRITTRYDKLSVTCDAAVCLVATVIWWL